MMNKTFDSPNNTKRNIVSNSSYNYTSSVNKDAGGKRVNYKSQESGTFLQRSVSADNVIVRTRGFKPSDLHDPAKRNFLENLTSKILHFDMESGERTPINLKKLLTPATDGNEVMHVKNKKMYASSYFYAPTHPTVEDQVELARRISNSLSDVKNMKSKGQSMYVNRKKRSVKWIHDGNGTEGEEETSTTIYKDKMPLKCLMNPCGKLQDIQGIQALGEEVNIESIPSHPEKLFDIVHDLNSQRGRGAEIFAKRRKRSEKWVVDKEKPQTPSTPSYPKTPTYPTKQEFNDNTNYSNLTPMTPHTPLSSFENKPLYNPFTMDLSTGNLNSSNTGYVQQARACNNSENGVNRITEVKKIYLREVAVGTDPELPLDDSDAFTEKSKRMSFKNEDRSRASTNGLRNNRYKSAFTNSNHSKPHSRPNSNSQYSSNSHHSNGHSHSNGHIQPNGNSHNNGNCHPNGNSHHNGYSQPNGYSRSSSYSRSNSNSRSNSYSNPNSKSKYHSNSKYSNANHIKTSAQTNGNIRNFRNGNQDHHSSDSEDIDYTPVPVKQLIQEFEKTCRPVMQYKHLSPKVIPIIRQNKPLNNDISRFFETHNKYEVCRIPEREEDIFERESLDSYRSNGYLSSEDLDESLDDSLSSMNYYQFEDRKPICENGFQRMPKGTRTASMSMIDEYFRKETMDSDEGETLIMNGNSKFIEIETEMPEEKKTRVLAMVGTEDDILDTIKHLRNTPVVDNLVSADCNFGTVCSNTDDGGKLYESNYQGPKISSYQNLANYNTAPRGWDQSLSFYRPIKFEKPPEKLVYSDF
ncbi:putative uncharacterized protein DDB_G0282133 isoform X2 [Belonocnema kinseyi]|uniref:putative uncharacterized protein DDB_G0282133 isoform X2 n=1 Tax=Belonocnema kinseyi TaxID=2817044 RepID=UPI00143D81BE|nr:putative uncharacterized protein DDB_G0282133 isoform X2 [Belonocnema kinseyi]